MFPGIGFVGSGSHIGKNGRIKREERSQLIGRKIFIDLIGT